jgi:hypothetical protein
MKTLLAAFGLAACLALAGCFTSEAPLFDASHGAPVFGKGRVIVTTFEGDKSPETGTLEWTKNGYIEPDKPDEGAMSFHHLPGSGWFSPWYVGQSNMGDPAKDGGYMYILYRKDGSHLYGYDLSCSDLTPAEAQAAHLVRKQSGDECEATRAEDLAQAFRLLSHRKKPTSYMTAAPAK